MGNGAAARLRIFSDIQIQKDLMRPGRLSSPRHHFLSLVSIIDGVAQHLQNNADTLTPEQISLRAQTMRLAVQRLESLFEASLNTTNRNSGKDSGDSTAVK